MAHILPAHFLILYAAVCVFSMCIKNNIFWYDNTIPLDEVRRWQSA